MQLIRGGGSGTVALEFALIAPILVAMGLGVFELSRALVIWEETCAAAEAIVEAAEKKCVQPDGSFSLSAADAENVMTAIYAEMPGLPYAGRSGAPYAGTFSVTLSSIALSPAGCTITVPGPCTAVPAWSTELQEGPSGQLLIDAAHLKRACGTPLVFTTTFPPDQTTLLKIPFASVTMQTPILVADVQYDYTPTFFQFIGPIAFWASAEFPVPGGNATTDYVQRTPGNDPDVCAGYL